MNFLDKLLAAPPAAGLGLALVWTFAANAASTKVWEMSEYEEFLPGKLEGVSLEKDGRLTLAPQLEEIATLEDPVVWAALAGLEGEIYLGTGHQGRLYRIDADGDAKVHWEAPEIEIFALAAGPGKTVFAGTSPNGKIYRVNAEGEAEEFFDPEEEYVWSLLYEEKTDVLYAGTGSGGKVYRIGASGEGEAFFDSGQRHVISLALDPEGRLLVGTDPNGMLYRVDAEGKAFSLYNSDLPEIHALRAARDGSIYFTALGGAESQMDQTVQTISSAASFSVTATAAGGAGGAVVSSPVSGATQLPQPSPVAVTYGLKMSAVVRLRPELSADELWSSTEENALGIALLEGDDSKILFTTDRQGRLYELDQPEGAERQDRLRLVVQTDARQTTSLTPRPEGLWVTAAHSGAIYRVRPELSARGVYQSPPLDARGIARWGRLSFEGAGKIELQTRSGNSPRPDGTWSEWSEAISSAEGSPITSPSARYLQWRAVLETGESQPRLDRVRAAYLPHNRPPIITSVSVEEDDDDGSDDDSDSTEDTGSPAAYSVTVTASGSSSASPGGSDNRAVGKGRGSRLSVSWEAEDPDGDRLLAKVEFRGEDEMEWKTLKEDVRQSKVSLDSQTLADGRYWFRVIVSDSPSNPPDLARTGRRMSEPVVIDHTPPAVRLAEVEGRERVRFTAEDSVSMIAAAAFSIDGGPWTPVHADDGVTDSRTESFTIPLTGLPAGERLVTLRVRDRAGNTGLAKAVIR